MTGRELVPYTPPPVPVVVTAPLIVQMIPAARLMNEEAAKAYLGGEPPETFGVERVPGTARRKLYDRAALDAALDWISGVTRPVDSFGHRSEPSPCQGPARSGGKFKAWQALNEAQGH